MIYKEFIRYFLAAFIGTIAYKLLVDLGEPFDRYWANFFAESGLLAVFFLFGLILIELISRWIPFLKNPHKS